MVIADFQLWDLPPALPDGAPEQGVLLEVGRRRGHLAEALFVAA